MVKRNKAEKRISNRLLYTLIAIGLLAIIGVGVYAVAPNPGHTAAEIDFSSGLTSLLVDGTGNYGDIQIGNPADFEFDGGTDSIFYFSNTGNSFGKTSFRAGTTELLTILNNGSVGIGTMSPVDKLHVVGGIASSDASTPNKRIWMGYNPGLDFGFISSYDFGSSSLKNIILSGANVGIGTTNPTSKLSVNGNISLGGVTMWFQTNGSRTQLCYDATSCALSENTCTETRNRDFPLEEGTCSTSPMASSPGCFDSCTNAVACIGASATGCIGSTNVYYTSGSFVSCSDSSRKITCSCYISGVNYYDEFLQTPTCIG